MRNEYNEMMTPRNDQNMERVEEANEEDLPGPEDQQQLMHDQQQYQDEEGDD